MVSDLVPPSDNVVVAVAGNYEDDRNDQIICPLCNFPSGWNSDLWIGNIPEIGLYCQNCKDVFYEGDFYNS